MPRYDDRYGGTRLYVGRLSSRTRSRDLDDLFSRYGRVRDVDMKSDFAFVEFSDPRDADDARYALNGRDVDGTRIIVEVAKGGSMACFFRHLEDQVDLVSILAEVPRRPPPGGSGRRFNCGLDGHWARDCKTGDWKNKCYRCGERGHIERNCQSSPKKLNPSRLPVKGGRSIERRSRSPGNSQSPKQQRGSPPPSKGRKRNASPDERSPQERGSPSPWDPRLDYSGSPRGRSQSQTPGNDAGGANGNRRSRSTAGETTAVAQVPFVGMTGALLTRMMSITMVLQRAANQHECVLFHAIFRQKT